MPACDCACSIAACAASTAAASAREVGPVLLLGFELGEVGFDLRHFRAEALKPLAMLAQRAVELIAASGQFGQRAGQFAEHLFGLRRARLRPRRRADRRRCAATAAASASVLQRLFLGGQAADRLLGIGGELLLAGNVLVELDQPPIEFGHALARARLFALQRLAREHQPMQCRRGLGLGLAQAGKFGGHQRLPLGGLGLRAGALAPRVGRSRSLACSASPTSAVAAMKRR